MAIFAILMLQRAYRERVRELEVARERDRSEREALIETIERNTRAWAVATQTMTSLAEAVCKNAQDLERIRVILARKASRPGDLVGDGE